MSERERWIVYPLLFLALGAALRDKIAKQTQTKEVVCERLFVVDSEGRSVAALVGDTSQLSLRDRQLLESMRRSNSSLALGAVLANVVDSESIFSLNKPVRPAGAGGPTMSIGDLLRYLQRMGVGPAAPQKATASEAAPPKTAAPLPAQPPTPPPAKPSGEAGPAAAIEPGVGAPGGSGAAP